MFSLNYPPVEREKLTGGGSRAGAHSEYVHFDFAPYRTTTDMSSDVPSYGSVTLLFQDNVGGLEVQDKAGNFIPAKPVEGTVGERLGPV